MNLLINDVCNRSCAYCFAQNRVQLGQETAARHNNIELTAVRTYLDFLKRSRIEEFKILGGEPTLHPGFCEIVNLGLAEGMKVIVFTNGMWNERVCGFASSLGAAPVNFVVNVNEPRYWTGREAEFQCRSLAAAGAKAKLGFNIFESDFDLRFVRLMIDRFGLQREVRLGLASPILNQENCHVSLEMRREVGNRLLDQLGELEETDILGAFDCGFVYCMFPPERWGSLIRSVRGGLVSVCHPIIDVGPDLTAWPCFPLSQFRTVALQDFENAAALYRHFAERLAPFRQFGTTPDCPTCEFFLRQQCAGGCLAHGLKDFARSDAQLLEKTAE